MKIPAVSAVLFVASALLVTPSFGAEADCIAPAEIIGARYLITDRNDAAAREFLIMRPTPARLVYAMPETHLTQVYENYGGGRVKLIEYFDIESIGVEYEPQMAEKGRDWASMYEIISGSTLAELEESSADDYRCLAVSHFSGTHGQAQQVSVDYLPQVRLPVSLVRRTEQGTKTWTLTSLLTDPVLIDQTLTRLEGYRLYDFADLGDSEHEPFFRKSRYLQYKLGHAH